MNTVNDAPSISTLNNPSDNGEVTVLLPVLKVNAASDVDNDSLTYEFMIYSDSELITLVTSTIGVSTNWTVDTNLTDNTRYWWKARAIDEHGLAGDWMAAASFFVNNNGYNDLPTITVTAPGVSEPVTNAASFTISWTAADLDSDPVITLYYDQTGSGYSGTEITTGIHLADPNSYTWDISGLADGSYYVYATIDDGTTVVNAYAEGTVIIDRTGPLATITGTPASPTLQTTATLTVAGIGVVEYKYTFDSEGESAAFAVATPISFTGLGHGLHSLHVIGKDGAGNWQTAATTENWVVDLTPPATPSTPSVSGAYSTAAAVTFTWTNATDPESGISGYNLQVGTAPGASDLFIAAIGNVTSQTVTGANGQTLYARVQAINTLEISGDWSESSSGITIDTTAPNAPTVSGVSPTNNSRPTWTWTPGGGGSGTFRRRLDGRSWSGAFTALSFRPITSLAEGSHTLDVQEKDGAGNWSASGSHTIDIVPALTIPAAPANLAGIWTEGTGVALTWTDNADNETAFRIYRKLSTETTWTKIGETANSAYTDSAATADMSWHYYVAAYNGAGSAKSGFVKVMTGSLTAPDTLKSTVTSTGVNLTWNDTSALEDGFAVYRKTAEETAWANLTAAAPVSADSTTYSDESAVPGVLYSYQVCAVTTAGGNACSGTIGVNGPGGLLATYQTGTGVVLTWTDNSVDEAGFKLYRKLSTESGFTQIGQTGPDVANSIDGTVVINGTYTYYVAAYNSAAAASSAKALVTTGSLIAPDRIKAATLGSQVSLTWRDTNTAEDGYEVWRRSADAGTWTRIVTLDAGSAAYTDTTSAAGILYRYQICATTAAGGQACAGAVGVNGPTNITATWNAGTGTVMNWTDNSLDETSFIVMRKESAATTWVKLPATEANATTATDPYSISGSYSYVVCATNGAVSNCGIIKTVVVP